MSIYDAKSQKSFIELAPVINKVRQSQNKIGQGILVYKNSPQQNKSTSSKQKQGRRAYKTGRLGEYMCPL
jgi:hypothetical protein